jgi:hypothetical protein
MRKAFCPENFSVYTVIAKTTKRRTNANRAIYAYDAV